MRHHLLLEDHPSILAALILTVWVVVPLLLWIVALMVAFWPL